MKNYVGTYDSQIKTIKINKNGKIQNPKTFTKIKNSKYLAKNKKHIFSIITTTEGSGIAVIDLNGNIKQTFIYESIPSCHIAVQNNIIYTANYHLGTITKLKYTNKISIINTLEIMKKAGTHQTIISKNKLYIPCLNLDKIIITDKNLTKIGEITLKKDSGPRHGIIKNNNLFIITEKSNQILQINIKTNQVTKTITLTTEKAASSAIIFSNNKKQLITATRIINQINIINIKDLKVIKTFSTYGLETRDIKNINDKYLLVANQNTNQIASISLKTYKKINEKYISKCAAII